MIVFFPDHFLPYRMLGFIYLKEKKDGKEAFELFRKSLELNPDQPDLRGLLRGTSEEEIPGLPPIRPGIPRPHPPEIPRPGHTVPAPKSPK